MTYRMLQYMIKIDSNADPLFVNEPPTRNLFFRFGLDFYLSNYVAKPIDIPGSDKAINNATNKAKVELHTSNNGITPQERNRIAANIGVPQIYDIKCTSIPNPQKRQIRILWKKIQKKILCEAKFAFIFGKCPTICIYAATDVTVGLFL